MTCEPCRRQEAGRLEGQAGPAIASARGAPLPAGFALGLAIVWLAALAVGVRAAEPEAPFYDELFLTSVFPAGAQRGSTVEVELRSPEKGLDGQSLRSFAGVRGLLIDGPPGIEVLGVENVSDTLVRARLRVASDAVPGRHMLRVHSERSGLSCFAYFVVGVHSEVREQEPNHDPSQAQEIALPVVVNGRIDPALDTDGFRFPGRAGQRVVAVVAAHAIDSRCRNPRGFTDLSLELLDSAGRTLAESADALGLDPLVEATLPDDGTYVVRVRHVNYLGFPDAVYRLAIGDLAVPTAAFPVAVPPGTVSEVEVGGPGIKPGTRLAVQVPEQPAVPVWHATSESLAAAEIPLVISDLPLAQEAEPNDAPAAALRVDLPRGVSGRFDRAGDADCYRVALRRGERIRAETWAQRWLRSPVDTQLDVLDAAGKSLATNDDVASTDVERLHDFEPFDSGLSFTTPADGEYTIRVSESTGAEGPRARYFLTLTRAVPDFRVHAWPDGVPVWGPGGTSTVIATVERLEGFAGDVELSWVGLPEGWQGGSGWSSGGNGPRRVFLSLTAPANAAVGTVIPLSIVGRAVQEGVALERAAQPLTEYMPDDRQVCRVSPQLRAAVTSPRGLRLEAEARDITVEQGQPTEVAVRLEPAEFESVRLVVNLAGNSFKCNLGVPQTVAVRDGRAVMPIACQGLPVGRHTLVVAVAWGSETRRGLPGLCTPTIQLNVVPPSAAGTSR